jgi:aryl-alcohol dehydrogenase-like predicted oxidoreductase
MQKRKLGFSDTYLTTVGLGAWAIGGGDWYWGWGTQDERQSVDTINRALDLGINWIDTAAAYGLGRSEELIGRAIAGRRDEVFIATKCGLVWGDDPTEDVTPTLKAASVRKEAEASLRRLNVEVIDLYQLHWPNPDEDIEEAWGVVANLVKEGKVRYAGGCNFNVSHLKRVIPIHPVAATQPEYSMLKRSAEEELLPFCEANNIGVVGYSPLRSGILTDTFNRARLDALESGDWRRRDPDFQPPQDEINLNFLGEVREIAKRVGRPLSQLAIAWVLANPRVTSAIVGARKPSQIEASAPAADWRLDDATMGEIEALLQKRYKELEAAGALGGGSLR